MNSGTTYSAILGSVIKNIRHNKGLSQGDMAEKMTISQGAWSNLESGKSALSTSQLARIADILEIPASEIIRYADRAKNDFNNKGFEVAYDQKDADSSGLMLLGAAAIVGVIAAIVLNKK